LAWKPSYTEERLLIIVIEIVPLKKGAVGFGSKIYFCNSLPLRFRTELIGFAREHGNGTSAGAVHPPLE
jgi:hypothetical protein